MSGQTVYVLLDDGNILDVYGSLEDAKRDAEVNVFDWEDSADRDRGINWEEEEPGFYSNDVTTHNPSYFCTVEREGCRNWYVKIKEYRLKE